MCRTSPTVTFMVTLCVIASLGRAQEGTSSSTGSTSRRPALRSAVELVALNVTVLDEHKRFVRDLGPEHFLVYENGIRQELAFFGLADVPVDLALLLDLSASMGTQMDVVRTAAIGFVRTLRPNDRAMLVGFADHVGQLERAVQQARPGATPLCTTRYTSCSPSFSASGGPRQRPGDRSSSCSRMARIP